MLAFHGVRLRLYTDARERERPATSYTAKFVLLTSGQLCYRQRLLAFVIMVTVCALTIRQLRRSIPSIAKKLEDQMRSEEVATPYWLHSSAIMLSLTLMLCAGGGQYRLSVCAFDRKQCCPIPRQAFCRTCAPCSTSTLLDALRVPGVPSPYICLLCCWSSYDGDKNGILGWDETVALFDALNRCARVCVCDLRSWLQLCVCLIASSWWDGQSES